MGKYRNLALVDAVLPMPVLSVKPKTAELNRYRSKTRARQKLLDALTAVEEAGFTIIANNAAEAVATEEYLEWERKESIRLLVSVDPRTLADDNARRLVCGELLDLLKPFPKCSWLHVAANVFPNRSGIRLIELCVDLQADVKNTVGIA